MKFDLAPGAVEIIKKLKNCGYQAYIVGGCVRDLLIGKEPHDWDICTSALPEQILTCFSGYKVIETGLQHGTVTVVVDDVSFEVTTFRIDGDYSDGRHPDTVEFTSNLEADLARRDFTINAMAMTEDGKVIDPFTGQCDLGYWCLRCVGDPVERFNEDGLRILRAIRFVSVYKFGVYYETKDAIHNCRANLRKVAPERIAAELRKMVVAQSPGRILRNYNDVLSVFWPELADCYEFDQKSKYHVYDVWEHTMHAMDLTDSNDLIVRLTLLLHDVGKPHCYQDDDQGYRHFKGHPPVCAAMADDMLRRLKFDNATREAVVELIEHHDATISPTAKSVRRWLNKLGPEQMRRLMAVKMGDTLAHNAATLGERANNINKVREILEAVLEQEQCFSMKDLAISGKDILALGVPEGPEVGRILNELLDMVIDGEIENDQRQLLQFLNNWIKGK